MAEEKPIRTDFKGTLWAHVPVPTCDIPGLTIAQEDLCDDEAVTHGKPYAVVDDRHITLLLGIPEDCFGKKCNVCKSLPNHEIQQMQESFAEAAPSSVEFDKLSFFRSEKKMFNEAEHSWDVLFVEPSKNSVSDLTELQSAVEKYFGVKWHRPEFNPHITVAYLKFGTAEKYIAHPVSFKASVDKIVISPFRSDKPYKELEVPLKDETQSDEV